jgi:hypothetical protein
MLFDASGLGVYGQVPPTETERDGRVWWNGHAYNKLSNVQQIDGGSDNNENGLPCQRAGNSEITALQEAYVREVIETVKNLDNVLYEINNEGVGRDPADDLDSTKWQYQMIDFIKNTEAASSTGKMHPVGMTGFANGFSNDPLEASDADWISPRHDSNDYEGNPPETAGDKVVILDTDHLWNNLDAYGTDRAQRAWVWKSFTRGYNPIYMDQMYEGLEDFGGASISDVSSGQAVPPSPYDDDVRMAMGHTRTYADKMNLIEMTPQSNLYSTTPPQPGYVLAKVQSEYLVYQPDDPNQPVAQPFTVTLPHGMYSVEWFNPMTGTTSPPGEIRGVGPGAPVAVSFQPPENFAEDAVLYLRNLLTVIYPGGEE